MPEKTPEPVDERKPVGHVRVDHFADEQRMVSPLVARMRDAFEVNDGVVIGGGPLSPGLNGYALESVELPESRKLLGNATCRSDTMLTPNAGAPTTASWTLARLPTQTTMSGGVNETAAKPVAVKPVGPCGPSAVTMVTPLAKWARASAEMCRARFVSRPVGRPP